MDADTAKTPLERIAELLNAHAVEYLVIGGQAEVLHGSPRVTFDVDLCYRRSERNLVRMADALRGLQPRLRGAPPDLPFVLDARSLGLGSNFTFCTDQGDLDLLGHVEPLGGYEELIRGAETVRVGDSEVPVIGLDDLIRIKEYLGRAKDKQALVQLLAIKRVRDQADPQ